MDNPTVGSNGEGVEAGFLSLEMATNQLKKAAAIRNADLEKRISGDREVKAFLVAELVAARSEIDDLKRNKQGETVRGVKRIPNVAEEHPGGKAPLEIFPLEVWCVIFDNLSDSKDLASCSNASHVFRMELKPKRTQFLFEQVLPILIENGVFYHWELFNRLLNLRRVCHAWKNGVNSFLDNHPCRYHLDDYCTRATNIYNPPSNLFDCFQPNLNVFSTPLKLQQCITYLKRCNLANPTGSHSSLIGKSIVLDDSNNNASNRRQFLARTRELLGLVGEGIWSCEIRKLGDADCLLPLLKRMPNLKVLKVGLAIYGDSFITDDQLFPPPAYFLLPELPFLQVLKVSSRKPCHMIVVHLLKRYKNLKKLQLNFEDYSQEDRVLMERTAFDDSLLERIRRPNLEALCVTVQSGEGMLQLGRSILNNMPSIHSLSLLLPNCAQFQDFGLIFSVLQGKTEVPIKSLKLTLQNPSYSVVHVKIRNLLRLPSLQQLTIDTEDKVVLENLDFILPLKSLQKLTLIRRKKVGEAQAEKDCVVNFHEFENRLYASNIWKLLPKLGQVLLKIMNERGLWNSFYYERTAYEKHSENGSQN